MILKQPPADPEGPYFKWEKRRCAQSWTGLAEGGWGFTGHSGGVGLRGRSLSPSQTGKLLNERLLSCPHHTSASGICPRVVVGSRTPLSFAEGELKHAAIDTQLTTHVFVKVQFLLFILVLFD